MSAGASHQVHELQAFQELAVAVLEPMCLVDDHAAPADLLQLGAVGHDHLKGGDDPMELKHAQNRVALWGKGLPSRERRGVLITF